MQIITISREFGSGGRELGSRLADYLGFAYYDKEILSAIARQSSLDQGYVQKVLCGDVQHRFPLTYGRTFSLRAGQAATELLLVQQKILKELAATGNCVMVGRAADTILQEFHPFNILVYAGLAAKLGRCRAYGDNQPPLADKALLAKIKQVDQRRRQYYALCTGKQWGVKENYHLCVNTTDLEIKTIVPAVGEYAKLWLARREP